MSNNQQLYSAFNNLFFERIVLLIIHQIMGLVLGSILTEIYDISVNYSLVELIKKYSYILKYK